MELIVSLTSPFARKARIIIAEKQINCTITPIVVWENPDIVCANNPLRKIPILILDDGTQLVNSSLICDYLDSCGDTPKFLPDESTARYRVKAREALVDGAADAALSVIMATKVAPDMKNENWENWLNAKAVTTFAHIENNINEFHTDNIDVADVALACTLDFLQAMKPILIEWDKYPKMQTWLSIISERTAFIDTKIKR